MKSFEEKCTAWADGAMSDAECAAFEAELASHPEERRHREEALALGQFLRSHGQVVALPNPDFFNQRIMEQIEADLPKSAPARSGRSLPLWRLVWAGAVCLVAAAALIQFAVPDGPYTSDGRDAYLAEVIETRTGSSSIYASSFHAEKNNVTVLWLEGLPYIPDAYAAQ